MAKVIVSSWGIQVIQVAANVVAGAVTVSLTDDAAGSPVIATQTFTAFPVEFDNVPDGTYTLTVQAYDTTGAPLGEPLSQSVPVVTAPATIGVNVPAGPISVTVQ